MSNAIVVHPLGTDLASRKSAAELRRQVVSHVEGGAKVIIDLSHVASLSESYADELFGVLAEDLGLTEFFDVVSVHGADVWCMKRIAHAIKLRAQKGDSGAVAATLRTLVVAKRARELYC